MNLSRRTLVSGGALAIGASLLAPTAAFARTPRAAAGLIDSAVRAALDAHASPGAQVAIGRGGELAFTRGYGLANLETVSPVLSSSVFRIGSLTKQFAAAAAIKLAASGKLQLDAPVARYLPFMEKLKAASLLDLMHHTAGLHSDETSAGPVGEKSQVDLAREIAAQAQPFDFEPGSAWLYSNANYIVLGAVIEAVTNVSLSQAFAEIICGPLGLTATAVDHASDIVAHRASGYSPTDNNETPFANAAFVEIFNAGGAGAMRSTASDLCRWHTALLAGRLFGPAEVSLMTTPGKLRDGRLSSANRFSPNDANYGETQYACGLLVSPPSDPHPNILHYGYIDGFAAVLQTYVNERVTMAVLCNGDVGPATPFRAIRRAVISHWL